MRVDIMATSSGMRVKETLLALGSRMKNTGMLSSMGRQKVLILNSRTSLILEVPSVSFL